MVTPLRLRRRTRTAVARRSAGRRSARAHATLRALAASMVAAPPHQHALPSGQRRVDDDGDRYDEHDQRIHGRIVEVVVGEAYFVADASVRHNELGADDADEGVCHSETNASK